MWHSQTGSYLEFLPILDLLRTRYTPETLPYHIICPSMPGYAFSSPPPPNRDFDLEDIARLFNNLMGQLGFGGGYCCQGYVPPMLTARATSFKKSSANRYIGEMWDQNVLASLPPSMIRQEPCTVSRQLRGPVSRRLLIRPSQFLHHARAHLSHWRHQPCGAERPDSNTRIQNIQFKLCAPARDETVHDRGRIICFSACVTRLGWRKVSRLDRPGPTHRASPRRYISILFHQLYSDKPIPLSTCEFTAPLLLFPSHTRSSQRSLTFIIRYTALHTRRYRRAREPQIPRLQTNGLQLVPAGIGADSA
jgi:hypothetical protein